MRLRCTTWFPTSAELKEFATFIHSAYHSSHLDEVEALAFILLGYEHPYV